MRVIVPAGCISTSVITSYAIRFMVACRVLCTGMQYEIDVKKVRIRDILLLLLLLPNTSAINKLKIVRRLGWHRYNEHVIQEKTHTVN